jgi:hypothetical protein
MVPRNALLFFRLFHVSSPHRQKAARFASSTFRNTLFWMLARERARSACGGPRLSPTARLRAQEYRLWLKRLPPIRQGGRFPPFKSSTAFRALAPPPLFAVLKRQLTFPFWKKNCASSSLFLSKTESKRFLERRERTKANGPTETVTAI